MTYEGWADDFERDVRAERDRQDAKWGPQRHPNGTGPDVEWFPGLTTAELASYARSRCQANPVDGDNWLDILLEEVFEASAEFDDDVLRVELIQCAAVIKAWIETIDARAEAAA